MPHHDVVTAAEAGWSQLGNGDLLTVATSEGFEVLVTTDQNLRYQQNLMNRRLAVVVLMTTSWPRMEKRTKMIVEAIDRIDTHGYVEVEI